MLLDDLETTVDHFGSGRAVVHSMALSYVEISGCMEPGIKGKSASPSDTCTSDATGGPFASLFGSRDRSKRSLLVTGHRFKPRRPDEDQQL